MFIENVEIIDTVEGGKGVAKIDGKAIFVKDAIPGDIVDIEIYKNKKNWSEANLMEIKKPSSYRQDPFCKHFNTCGGCRWQHMTYEGELFFKNKKVVDALERIGGLTIQEKRPILANSTDRLYRNKLEFTFSANRWLTNEEVSSGLTFEKNVLGFHVPRRFDKIFPISECFLQEEPSNAIRNFVYDLAIKENLSFYNQREHEGLLRNLIIRTTSTGQVMVVFAFGEPEMDNIEFVLSQLKENFKEITSLNYTINQKKNDTLFDQNISCFDGKEFIEEVMHTKTGKKLVFNIGPKTFYQTNSLQAQKLYEVVNDFAEFNGDELVYDLYTGAGTIANFVADQVKKVVGIEYVESAIEDAKINSINNKIENTEFFAGDMKDLLNEDFIEANGRPDIVITDPPRAGMHPGVVETIEKMAPNKIVYVSCNASTQARDVAMLTSYEVCISQAVDMFPQTDHVENVVLLKRK
ncbi:MAG: 23S rRNA (uracil1939-C5)-methyltransferase [Sphingobacteriales bacterium]|jgi:23S rRNA (uracil1939-C5)-methyltransferase